jgi:hypothetical protein
MPDPTFETRLAQQLGTYAQGGVRPIDRHAVAEATIATRARRRLAFRLAPVLVGLLLLAALAAGAALVGAQLLDRRPDTETPQQPAVVAPTASADATNAIGNGPCAAMVQLIGTYIVDDATSPLPPGPPERTLGTDDILFSALGQDGQPAVGRMAVTGGTLKLVTPGEGPDRVFPSLIPMDPRARLSISADGRALAIEAGDLGQAGCGDPIVVLADGGRRRPFPSGASRLVGDLAWAPDGSALYAIRRPTLDARGLPYYDADLGRVLKGPGTVLRWDTATGQVTELPPGCGACGRIFVSPDGARLAAESAGVIKVYDAIGGWRDLTTDDGLIGWASDASVVLNGSGQAGPELNRGRTVGLDGTAQTQWDGPCCHDPGDHGLLSPDGTTIASIARDSNWIHPRVTLLDVRDGSTRSIWNSWDVIGCNGWPEGSPGLAGCLTAPRPTPGSPDAMSASARIVAWAPDGSAVLLLDQRSESTAATLQVVPVDASGARAALPISVPDLSGTLGFPNIGPSVVWLPATAP